MNAASTLDALSLAEISFRWRCSVSTVRRKIARGLLPSFTLPGSNRPLVPTAAVFAAERPRQPTASTEKPAA